MVDPIQTGMVTGAHLGLESAFNGGGTISGSTLLGVLPGSMPTFQSRTRHDNEESTGSRDSGDPIDGKFDPVPFSIDHYLYLQPDGATASAIEAMLIASMGETTVRVTPSGKTTNTGCTSSVIKVSNGTDFNLFDLIPIDGQPAAVTKVEATQITIDPPLSSAPASGKAIGSARVYHLAEKLPSIFGAFKRDSNVLRCSGGVVTDMKIEKPGSNVLKITISGSFAQQIMTGTAGLANAVATTSATTFNVDNPYAFEVGSLFDCENETGIGVTAVNYTTGDITVTRGFSPTSHAQGKTLAPHWIEGTLSGAQAHGKGGRTLKNDGTGVETIPATANSISLANGSSLMTEEEGSEYASDQGVGKRKVTVEVKHNFRQSDTKAIRQAQLRETFGLVTQAIAGGRGFALYFRKLTSDIPTINDGDQLGISRTMTAGIATDADGNVIRNRVMVASLW